MNRCCSKCHDLECIGCGDCEEPEEEEIDESEEDNFYLERLIQRFGE
jgi:hypothetical protein